MSRLRSVRRLIEVCRSVCGAAATLMSASRWVEGIHNAMQPYTTGGAYVNIPDRTPKVGLMRTLVITFLG